MRLLKIKFGNLERGCKEKILLNNNLYSIGG